MTFPPTLKTFPGTFIAVRTAQNSTQKVCRTRENSLLCSYCNRREKFNFPPLFPLQSQCIPVIHGFYLECLASLDIQTEAIHDRKTLTFWGKTKFLLSLKTFPKKIAIDYREVILYSWYLFLFHHKNIAKLTKMNKFYLIFLNFLKIPEIPKKIQTLIYFQRNWSGISFSVP